MASLPILAKSNNSYQAGWPAFPACILRKVNPHPKFQTKSDIFIILKGKHLVLPQIVLSLKKVFESFLKQIFDIRRL